mmetsp:Transcript_27345/g.20491  ORF Transcript_27345/g.20491 Transcript_27345/m.20491 type:complete len:136 (+) Transcript_27345:626-1033(+)
MLEEEESLGEEKEGGVQEINDLNETARLSMMNSGRAGYEETLEEGKVPSFSPLKSKLSSGESPLKKESVVVLADKRSPVREGLSRNGTFNVKMNSENLSMKSARVFSVNEIDKRGAISPVQTVEGSHLLEERLLK